LNDIQLDPLVHLRELITRAAKHLHGDLDLEQVELYELAFARAQVEAALSLQNACEGQAPGTAQALLGELAEYYGAETHVAVINQLARHPQAYGLTLAELPQLGAYAEVLSPARVADLGTRLLEQGIPIVDDNSEHALIRDTFAQFSDDVVAPLAEDIHRHNQLVPEAILQPLRELGCFGLSVPMQYGGLKPDDHEDSLAMVVVTEELSRGSLGAAGSLITRPEIMARALLEGGTDEQKQRWLPGLAAGDPLCAISVTEPGVGSDVANVSLKAERTTGGWLLSGGKTWCTFAGKAEVILVLARTDGDILPPHKGLSLFVVEKPKNEGLAFEYEQPVREGQTTPGRVSGRAIETIGYRGMHSYEMFYDDFFVPDDCLVGESAGEGKGFYFTMRGFMGGRLQTAARACGLMRAAFDAASTYAQDRMVFARPVAGYPLTRAKFALMGASIAACRAFTNDVAALMDNGEGAMEASLVKLLACRAAERISREALQIHGGMGYAEETPVSRYFADARVLSIFEGAEETLAIRVVGKALTQGQ